MSDRIRFRPTLVLLAYAAAFLFGPLHEFFLEEEQCARCVEEIAAGPRLEADCRFAGPCEDPDHHHHAPRHAHDDCLACRAARDAAQTAPSFDTWVVVSSVERSAAPSVETVREWFLRGRPSPRAPPALS